jgi:hypothetical protein
MGYSRIRPELKMSWVEAELRDLEGNELYWRPKTEWVKSICFDGIESGLYVLTEDDDNYFTAHSIDLEFEEEIPAESKPAAFAKEDAAALASAQNQSQSPQVNLRDMKIWLDELGSISEVYLQDMTDSFDIDAEKSFGQAWEYVCDKIKAVESGVTTFRDEIRNTRQERVALEQDQDKRVREDQVISLAAEFVALATPETNSPEQGRSR